MMFCCDDFFVFGLFSERMKVMRFFEVFQRLYPKSFKKRF